MHSIRNRPKISYLEMKKKRTKSQGKTTMKNLGK